MPLVVMTGFCKVENWDKGDRGFNYCLERTNDYCVLTNATISSTLLKVQLTRAHLPCGFYPISKRCHKDSLRIIKN